MKTLSFPSLCKRAVALLVLAAGLCASVHAETRWTKSMFQETQQVPEKAIAVSQNTNPTSFPPLFLMGKFENGSLYLCLRTYDLNAYMPRPLSLSFILYGGPGWMTPYIQAETGYVTISMQPTIYGQSPCLGGWIKMDQVLAPIEYYSIGRVSVTLHVHLDVPGEYLDYYNTTYLNIEPSFIEALEQCSLKDPETNIISGLFVTNL